MPGFGPILGATLLVTAGDLAAFPSAGHLAAAAGLVPVPNDSGRRTGNLHKPRRYSRPLRHVFYLSAQTSMMRDGPNRDYYLKKRQHAPHPQPGRHRPRPPPRRRPVGTAARQPDLRRNPASTRARRLTTPLRFPMPGLAGFDVGGAVMDRLHVRGLLQRTVAGAAPAPAVPVSAAGAQVLRPGRDNETSVDALIDGLGAHVPAGPVRVAAPQPAADLGRRPGLGQLARHRLPQLGVAGEPPWPRPRRRSYARLCANHGW